MTLVMADHQLVVGFTPRYAEGQYLGGLLTCTSEALSLEAPLSPLSAAIKTINETPNLPPVRINHRQAVLEDGRRELAVSSAEWPDSCSHSSTPIRIPDSRCCLCLHAFQSGLSALVRRKNLRFQTESSGMTELRYAQALRRKL